MLKKIILLGAAAVVFAGISFAQVLERDGGEIDSVPPVGQNAGTGTASVSTSVVKMGDITAEPINKHSETETVTITDHSLNEAGNSGVAPSATSTVTYNSPASPSTTRPVVNDESVIGWVTPSSLTKSLDVKVGTKIYERESTSSKVLAVVAAGDKVETLRMGDEMVEVRLVRITRTYVGAARAGEAYTPPPAVVNTPPPPPPPTQTTVSSGSNDRMRNAYVDENGNESGSLNMFEGRLKKAWALVGPGSDYEFKLVDTNGNLVGYVDFSSFRNEETMKSYLDQEVLITGSMETLTKNGDLTVIRARSARLK